MKWIRREILVVSHAVGNRLSAVSCRPGAAMGRADVETGTRRKLSLSTPPYTIAPSRPLPIGSASSQRFADFPIPKTASGARGGHVTRRQLHAAARSKPFDSLPSDRNRLPLVTMPAPSAQARQPLPLPLPLPLPPANPLPPASPCSRIPNPVDPNPNPNFPSHIPQPVGAGLGLERWAQLAYGIDDIRKIEDARIPAAS